jgi:hypothetical protein
MNNMMRIRVSLRQEFLDHLNNNDLLKKSVLNWVWNGVHSLSLVRTTEELLRRNISGSGQENGD